MLIGLGCDQAGYDLMQEMKAHLQEKGYELKDYGTYSKDAVDYPIYGKKVAEAVLNKEVDKGLLICGTGIGISLAANRYAGIRAALCGDVFSAKAARLHNDANILAMGGRVLGVGLAAEIVDAFFETEFSNAERHARRISMIEINEGEK